jgi:type IV pilus assembly protein PilW
MSARRTPRRCGRARELGLSLIELLVALAIGAFLIFGATQVYVDSRNAYGVNETVARLQETARYAISVIEPDVRMANYWGLVKGASIISGQTSQQSGTAVPNWSGVTVCGNNFATDLNVNLQADDDQYLTDWTGAGTATPVPSSCDTVTQPDGSAWSTTPVTTADTLTVRRASVVTSPSTNGWLQICSTRLAGQLISTGSVCTATSQQVNNLIVNAYYVDQNSSQANGLPSLRRKTLIHPAGGQSRFADQEVIPGIEDMQVQIGIDNSGISAIATRYIDPSQLEAAIQGGAQVVSVRIWLLVRSDAPEVGFTDDRVYEYGNRLQANGITGDLNAAGAAGLAYQPSQSGDAGPTGRQHYRRLLVSRTIQIRNALGT